MKVEINRQEVKPEPPPIKEVVLHCTVEEAEIIAALSFCHEWGNKPEHEVAKNMTVTATKKKIGNGSGVACLIFERMPKEIKDSARAKFGLGGL